MREAQELTLRQVASRAGVSFAYLAQVERGDKEPTDRWLRDVIAALVPEDGAA
jgi:transcriptional regulator with XRE-family HTH domain